MEMAHFFCSSLTNNHTCAIYWKHYMVHSCDGCISFFKRIVLNEKTYACRNNKNCVVDKRRRNQCRYCRYMKCLAMGMKREALQEKRQRVKEKGEEVESTSGANNDMPTGQILEAELAVQPKIDTCYDTQKDPVANICHFADKELFTLVEWTKRISLFTELPLEDQVMLLRADVKRLVAVQEVEQFRENVFASLQEYCKTRYTDEPGRFAKLLLGLPALRSIGLKCHKHPFFLKLIGDTPIDTCLMNMLRNPSLTI